MNTDQKRQLVMGAYSGKAWQAKVKAMSDNQIIAVYFRLLAQKKI